jgi:uncharacterized protein
MTAPTPAMTASDERTWSWMAHLSGLFSFIGPLIVWLVHRERSPVVAREAKGALNFQLTVAIVTTALFVIGAVLTVFVIGFAVMLIASFVPIVGVAFAVVGAVVTNGSGHYRYPLTLRLVR